MEILDPLLVNSEAIFRFLALNCFYSAILALLVLTIKLLFPRLPRTFEYGLWCLVLVRLVLPTEFSLSYSLGHIGHAWFNAEIPDVINTANWLSNIAGYTIYQSDTHPLTCLKLLGLIWATVSLIVAYKFVKLKFKLSKLLTIARPVEDSWLTNQLNFWRREFKIRRQIIVIDSDDFLSPFTFATFSPVIFIPAQLLKEKNHQVLGPIIAHELAHIKRLDALWLLFQNSIQIIYCLNPVVWLAVRRLNSLREEICDREVLSTQAISGEQYGKSLLHVLRLNIGRRSPELFATFFLSHKKVFKKRIAAIGRNKPMNSKMLFQYITVGLCAVFFLPLGWQPTMTDVSNSKLPVENEPIDSPFPAHIRDEYQAPVLLKENKKNKIFEEVELNQ
ncbi:MAG: M56 family metallopeptidase [Kangiellaceae bacterium]|nr:M56 family metallopeptidase [Kangiellaceae bacterium]